MKHPIDNQYRYGICYDLKGQIIGFNLSPDFFVPLTDDEIERALETYAIGKLQERGNMKKLDEAIERFSHNAEYERTHENLQGCLEFKQLAKWLKELKAYREMYHKEHVDDYFREEGRKRNDKKTSDINSEEEC